MNYIQLLYPFFPIYIAVFCAYMTTVSIIELFIPIKIYNIWHSWVFSSYFRYYGIIAFLAGFPLTQFRNNIPGYFMSVIGFFIVFSGPVIFLYPEKFRELFPRQGETFSSDEKKHLVWADALLRFMTSVISFWAVFSQGFFN